MRTNRAGEFRNGVDAYASELLQSVSAASYDQRRVAKLSLSIDRQETITTF